MRVWRHFGVVSAIMSLSFATGSGQTAPAKPSRRDALVCHVLVRGTDAAMEVEIQTSGATVEPDSQSITGPDRIVVDFPGALPAAELRALKVNRGPLKAVRSGLFFSNPPITRVVLDLAEPQAYQISTNKISETENAIVIKLAPGKAAPANQPAQTSAPQQSAGQQGSRDPNSSVASGELKNASLSMAAQSASIRSAEMVTSSSNRSAAQVSNPAIPVVAPPISTEEPTPAKPAVTVTFEKGMLTIHSERATLAQVLYEVHLRTHAEIAIPAGAEQEEVFADLGPGLARDVLGSLLNGSPYNFIFVGTETTLEQVIMSRRDPGIF
jgi:hypothetical protein